MSETEIKEEEVLAEAPNVVTKDAEKAEPTHLENDAEDLGAPVVKPTDSNPDSTKKVSKVSDQVNKDAKDGSLEKDNKPTTASEEVEIDLTDDVKALVSADADLSEDFKDKAATIFETAVKTRIKEQSAILEAQFEEKLASETETTVKEAMVAGHDLGVSRLIFANLLKLSINIHNYPQLYCTRYGLSSLSETIQDQTVLNNLPKL